MAGCVDSHGGDILKFAGDAILVCWPLHASPDAAADSIAARAAADCARAMQRLDATAPAPGEPPLALHIAMHAGTLAEMHLGDGDAPGGRWEFLIAGAPLRELAPLMAAAGPGEVVVSDAVWALLGRSTAVAAGSAVAGGARLAPEWVAAPGLARTSSGRGGDRALPALSAAARALAERYVPRTLVDTLAGGTAFWLAENRRVAVLFASLPHCGDGDFALAQALVAEMHAVAARSGGQPQQSICDDKGTVSIAVWGKPPLSHADDALRALTAAQTLAASLRRIAGAAGRTEPIAIGVTSGRAFCGSVGSALRCEWCVVGDVMNTAARLMAAAAARGLPIYCDSAVARAAADAASEEGMPPPKWYCEGSTPLQLKGFAGPFAAFAPPAADELQQAYAFAGGAAMMRSSSSAARASQRSSSADMVRPGSGSSATSRRSSADGAPQTLQHRRSMPRGSDGALPEGGVATPPATPSNGGDDVTLSDEDEIGSLASTAFDRVNLLFGRDADILRVGAMLADADSRAGLLLVVSGGLSMGKTSFLRACAAAARDAGAAVFALAAPGGGVAAEVPYHSWHTPWFAELVAEALPDLPPHLRATAPLLAELLPPGALEAQLRALSPDADASNAAIAALSEEARAAALAELASEVLRPAIADGSGLILQDDLPEADALSCELLASVLATLRPAVLVAAGRGELDDPDSGAAAAVAVLSARAAAVRAATLGPLDAAAVDALASHELGAAPEAPLPPGLSRTLMALTGGHPLFVKELITLLLRQNHLALGEDGNVIALSDVSKLEELAALGPAGSDGMARLEVLVQRRVDSLGPAARSALKAAAVLGRDFDLPLLAKAYSGHVTLAAARALAAELVDEGMWIHVRAPPIGHHAAAGGAASGRGGQGGSHAHGAGGAPGAAGAKYRFAHEVVRALVYASTPADQRVELHGRVLRVLEDAAELGGGDDAASPAAHSHGRGAPVAAPGGARSSGGAGAAMQWAEFARHARGSNQHTKASSYFLASARASATGLAQARRAADAARFAQEGLASLNAADEQAASRRGPRLSHNGSSEDLTSLASPSKPAKARPLDTLRAELMAVLDNVRRVQASWALVEPAMDTHGVTLMLDFFRRCPDSLHMFSFGGMALDDPAAAPKMRKHAITLMSTVGTCVAGLRDFEAMIPTLVSVGRMHYKFGDNIRTYFPPMGQALMVTLRAALGADFTADVESAWQATYEVICLHIFDGIDRAERAAQEQSSLRGQLMGTL